VPPDLPNLPTVGIIANPDAGRDVRRLIANAATSTVTDKIAIVRRVAVGAVQAGARRLLVLPDPHGICRQALRTLHLDAVIEEIVVPRTHDERETVRAAAVLRDEGAGAVVVLGGDGTNRAVALGWCGAPVVPLSTGTNNVFPVHVEPTIAGAAAGLVASGAVPLVAVARRAKTVPVEVDGEPAGLALVDALLVADRFVGSRVLFAPDRLVAAVLAIADPASVGVSPIGGLIEPCLPDDDAGVELRFGPDGRVVSAPMSPGLYAPVRVAGWSRLALGQVVEATGPAILAFDGDRHRSVAPGATVTFRVERDGPNVIDVAAVMAAAAAGGLYVTDRI
jgi:hypothetical protein